VAIICLGGSLLVWWPNQVIETRLQAASLGRDLIIRYPQHLYPGETRRVTLRVEPAFRSEAQPQAIATRLDLPGLASAAEIEGQVIAADKQGLFDWDLYAKEPGDFSGRLWVYAGEEQTPVLAREVRLSAAGPRIELVWIARFLLPVGTLVGVIFLLRKL
jgi:hypothetical protein